MTHYDDCAHALWRAWKTTHPHSCDRCQATGYLESTENGAPHGAGYWPMPVSDPCPNCLEQGKCPRCAAELPACDDPDEEHCLVCGWNVTSDPAPANGPCLCLARWHTRLELLVSELLNAWIDWLNADLARPYVDKLRQHLAEKPAVTICKQPQA